MSDALAIGMFDAVMWELGGATNFQTLTIHAWLVTEWDRSVLRIKSDSTSVSKLIQVGANLLGDAGLRGY